MVIALAGRRVDAKNSKQIRFPLNKVQQVSQRLEQTLTTLGCQHLFCSGACGTDLLALSLASKLGIGRTMILPFHYRQFRSVSVIDRPGNWGPIFDQVYEELFSQHHVHILSLDPDDEGAFAITNKSIIMTAIDYANGRNLVKKSVGVVIAWDGESYGQEDTTGLFLQEAISQKLTVYEIKTL